MDDAQTVPGLAEQTAARLRDEITGGAVVPGQRLSEAQLAKRLDVSRNTLREVFRLLTREGLLRHEPNRGVFVATPSMASILDIYRVRRLIEVPALAQAWPRHEAVARMHAAVDHAERMAALPDWQAVGSANMDFHSAIVALTDSPRLMGFFAQISAELRLAFGLLDSPELLHEPFIRLNRAIVDRIEAGDAKAASEMLEEYLTRSERTIMAAFARLG
ncbi:GntR family transcriptional regulator [Paracoccus siganidrum]|uniref:GntR family transcriptional regulator n=1 Tax=Paracoccus siganidrum TaxID=1276757 RepID=A0A419A4H2_9RHOB|nr:GntR family transcriptional regulator [Paracoccus siganidrum]RJL09330.1 GntR family transcriptional regulator [Paracoccus siganidrum]RMC39764.1 GntR family transcriptional regulator [Paracoccus siganidrum]